ncbi:MAG: hypothetical protein P8X98_07695, partial [Woeseiaceae bacterium]
MSFLPFVAAQGSKPDANQKLSEESAHPGAFYGHPKSLKQFRFVCCPRKRFAGRRLDHCNGRAGRKKCWNSQEMFALHKHVPHKHVPRKQFNPDPAGAA